MESINQAIMYFHKGGLVMWPLLLCSFLVIAIGVERFLYYKAADSGSKFADNYCALLATGTIADATKLAGATSGALAKVLTEAAELGTNEEISSYAEMKSGIIIAKLRDKLSYLSVVVTLSPLLGLLGTIVGMIGAFSIFNLQAGAPMAITGGIGEALIATATGLCVAIVALCIHSYFAHRMDNIITGMEQCFSALLEARTRSDH